MAQVSTIQQLKNSIISDLVSFIDRREALSITKIILGHLGFSENQILANPGMPVDRQLQSEVNKITDQLHLHRPIQYILGETEFYGHRLVVNEHVLIPRQETELMVQHVIAECGGSQPNLIDLGTGSGCIAIALKSALPGARVYATDISDEALSLARNNAAAHQAEITFIEHDMLGNSAGLPAPTDIIVSNPPYVTVKEKAQMQDNVLKYEPGIALFVPSEDPLLFYRAIIHIADQVLKPHGNIWVEINEKFGQETCDLFRSAGYARCGIMPDLHGKDRFIKASRK